jgi:predicted O-methyltransferase YrrM
MFSVKLKRSLQSGAAILDNFLLAYFTDRGRRVKFVNSVLGFAGHARLKDRFPTVELPPALADAGQLTLLFDRPSHRPGNVAFPELCTLVSLARARSVQRVFEFGTFDGNTAFHIALNTDESCQIYTVDIPPGTAPLLAQDEGDDAFQSSRTWAYRWQGVAVAPKIHPLLSDSARLDISAYRSSMDLIFIDGAHSSDYIANDTALAMEMARPGGLIVWHDYLVWNDVTTFLQEFSATHQLVHVAATSLVIYQVPAR